MIEGIERVKAKLQADSLCDLKILEDTKIDAVELIGANNIDSRISLVVSFDRPTGIVGIRYEC